MSLSWWTGVGLGIGIMGLHATARVVTHRVALKASDRQAFLVRELGGLMGRMVLVFGAVSLVLLLVPIHEGAFVTTVLTLLLLSMLVETYLIRRKMDRGTLEP